MYDDLVEESKVPVEKTMPFPRHCVGKPIPPHHLRSFLEELLPKDYKKNEINKWEQKTEELVISYTMYAQGLYGKDIDRVSLSPR